MWCGRVWRHGSVRNKYYSECEQTLFLWQVLQLAVHRKEEDDKHQRSNRLHRN